MHVIQWLQWRDARMFRRGAAWSLLLVVPACFHPSYDRPACGPGGACPDGLRCNEASLICELGTPVDGGGPSSDSASLDGTVPALCLGTFVNVCVDPPQVPVMLATQTIDTSTSSLCAAYRATPATDACVVAGTSIVIPGGAAVTVIGSKKLILLSAGSITISGLLDVASHQDKPSGPAADAGPCPTTGFTNPTRGTQGGGGWGGGLGTSGNNGGNSANPGLGGISPATFAVTGLRGGCPGSDGADNAAGSGGGARGRGGGAVLLLATQMITIDGTVNASGAGGFGGGAVGGGGGGGGAGGMIVLDAATVNTPGKCFANGGGGGQGGMPNTGQNGGESTAPASRGLGGKLGSVEGGQGGDGAFATTGSTPGGNGAVNGPNSGAGGGGGGGAGVIKIIAPSQSNTNDPAHVSPLPS